MRGCFDGTCTGCGARIGWVGLISDKPACRRCGLEPDTKELDKAAEEMRKVVEALEADERRGE